MRKSKRILIVDDDSLMRRSASALLKKSGYEEILTAADGREGLELFRREKPDLTLLDLRMPEMDGLDFLEEVQEEIKKRPVIILSGAGSVADVIRSLQLGAWDYVVKPLSDFSILDHSMQQAFERARLMEENRRYQDFLEEEVQKRTTELYQAQKMEAVGTLAGGIAHDFNNLLSSIIGYCEMAQEQLPPDGQPYRDLENVLQAAGAATELVKQILTFSRQAKMEVQPVQVQDVLHQIVKLVKATFPSSIEIRGNIDPDCKPILADPTQLQQIVMNLCTNAKQAMAEGVGSISLSLQQIGSLPDYITREAGQGAYEEYLQLTVADTGKGIEGKELAKIFEPFYTTKPVGQGTGLGLSVAHGIVSNMDGNIHVTSTPGKGTRFEIFLPVVNVFESEEEETTAEIAGGTERILLVDDDPRIVQILERGLGGMGYRVTPFQQSTAALEAFTGHPDDYDLVITDMTMPRLTGKELAGQMLAVRPDIPIIMCTGYSEVMDSSEAKEIGIRRYVMKPIIKKDLAAIIRQVLDNG